MEARRAGNLAWDLEYEELPSTGRRRRNGLYPVASLTDSTTSTVSSGFITSVSSKEAAPRIRFPFPEPMIIGIGNDHKKVGEVRGRHHADIKSAIVLPRRRASSSSARSRSRGASRRRRLHRHQRRTLFVAFVMLVIVNSLVFCLQDGLDYFLPPIITVRHLSVEQVVGQLAVDSVSAILPLEEPGSCDPKWDMPQLQDDRDFSSAWTPSAVLAQHSHRIGQLCEYATTDHFKRRPDLTRLCHDFRQGVRAARDFKLGDWESLGAAHVMLRAANSMYNAEANLDDDANFFGDNDNPDGINQTAMAISGIYVDLVEYWHENFRSLVKSIAEYDNAIGLMEASEGYILDAFDMYVNKAIYSHQQPKRPWRKQQTQQNQNQKQSKKELQKRKPASLDPRILEMEKILTSIRTSPGHCFVSRMRGLSANAVTAATSMYEKTGLILQDLTMLGDYNWRLDYQAKPTLLDDQNFCPPCPLPGSKWRHRHCLWVFDDLLTLRLSLEKAAEKVTERVRRAVKISEAAAAADATRTAENRVWSKLRKRFWL